MPVPWIKCVDAFISIFIRSTPEGNGFNTLLFLEGMILPERTNIEMSPFIMEVLTVLILIFFIPMIQDLIH